MLKLHLGCGHIHLEEYINVDILKSQAVDVCCDLKVLPWPDNSVDCIYACAVIEHFGRYEWISVLSEWNRVLKKGGMLRISTSDFDSAVEQYNENKNLNELLGLLIGGQKDQFDFHGMIFNFEILQSGLEIAGFGDIKRYRWQDTDIGLNSIDDYSQAYLPHMDKTNGRLMMLNIEAVKL